MITLRRSAERGHTRIDWLDSRHTFSFGDYYDEEHMGFRALRVINEDRVERGKGFGRHPHREMEIISYVVEGSLEHQDSLGTGSIIKPGEVQRMTAGTGVFHSEYNPSRAGAVHFLQIWIVPEKRGLPPSYEQRPIAFDGGGLRLVASRDGKSGSVTVHQDVALYVARLEANAAADLDLAPGRHAWVQTVKGSVSVNGTDLQAGDGAALSDESKLTLRATANAEVLVFDLA